MEKMGNLNQKIRLLRVLGSYAGGMKSTIDSLDKELSSEEIIEKIALIFGSEPEIESSKIIHEKRETIVVSGNAKKNEIRNAYRMFLKIRRIILDDGINIVCVHSPYMLIANSAALACVLSGVPYILYYHG